MDVAGVDASVEAGPTGADAARGWLNVASATATKSRRGRNGSLGDMVLPVGLRGEGVALVGFDEPRGCRIHIESTAGALRRWRP